MRLKVLEIPSRQRVYGILATLLSEASAPEASRPCSGLAPGAKGWPFLRPSGVDPVFLPYTTLLVMVRMESVGIEFLRGDGEGGGRGAERSGARGEGPS